MIEDSLIPEEPWKGKACYICGKTRRDAAIVIDPMYAIPYCLICRKSLKTLPKLGGYWR